MKEIRQYRAKLLKELVASAREFRKACLAVQDPSNPLEKDGWSVHQIAAHVRDVDRLAYGLRTRRTAQEENPEFENFDGEAHARQHYARDESLAQILDGFVQSVESMADMLRALSPDSWSRLSRHETLGANLTLQLWVERSLAHIKEHLETVNGAN
jgi:hypothetical protein